MTTFDIVTFVMIVGMVFMFLSGREIDKQTRRLHERNKRERERFDRLFPDSDGSNGSDLVQEESSEVLGCNSK